MRSLSFGNSLAESTLLTGLEIAFVHSPSPAEAQSQPDYQERRHPVMGSKDKNISFSVQSHLDATPGRANQTTVQELGNRQHTQTDFGLYGAKTMKNSARKCDRQLYNYPFPHPAHGAHINKKHPIVLTSDAGPAIKDSFPALL